MEGGILRVTYDFERFLVCQNSRPVFRTKMYVLQNFIY